VKWKEQKEQPKQSQARAESNLKGLLRFARNDKEEETLIYQSQSRKI
jgi:hypothetical protein